MFCVDNISSGGKGEEGEGGCARVPRAVRIAVRVLGLVGVSVFQTSVVVGCQLISATDTYRRESAPRSQQA